MISPHEIDGCQFCHEFGSSYLDCLLRANIKGAYLPTIYKYSDHEHPLNFTIMPFSFNFQYKCCACGEMGKFVSDKCFQCNYDLHTKCALVITKDVILDNIKLFKAAFPSHYHEFKDFPGNLSMVFKDSHPEFALGIPKDVILHEVNRVGKFFQPLMLVNTRDLTKRQKIVIHDSLQIHIRIREELDIISEDLNAYSNETLPLQHANYLKTRIELFYYALELLDEYDSTTE
ncbi:unnamed protein product [Dovyalis caffra]|uniref:DC1 domain-containing protein n=1 Tax=Dovyalis caffra TaxID=77055 RepID=A0AAV1QQU3_9ROSI|nr:unnamed protein product [Dovyalis caffra]